MLKNERNDARFELIRLDQLEPNVGQLEGLPSNPRRMAVSKMDLLKQNIQKYPDMLTIRGLLVYPLDNGKYIIIGGNMRYQAMSELGFKTAPSIIIPKETSIEQLKAYSVIDNNCLGEWDWDMLANEWDAADLDDWGLYVWKDNGDFQGDGDGDGKGKGKGKGNDSPANASYRDRFVIPPFSVFDSRKGYWQARKKMWRSIISNIDIGKSREDILCPSLPLKYGSIYKRTQMHRKKTGCSFSEYLDKYVPEEVKERESRKVFAQGTSLFDPVLAEVVMRWFCPPAGSVLDPFGGEPTKGLVAGVLGLKYVALEIRPDQVRINMEACRDYPDVLYHCADSNDIGRVIPDRGFDLCFTSPPYFDLEVYSKEDMSALGTYDEFMAQYENIFRQCVDMLADGAFLVVKIGEIRDKRIGAYRNFVGDNISMFLRLGLAYYNEIILIVPVGSLGIGASRYMDSRKVSKVHQNILVFYKGDIREIKKKYPRIHFNEEDSQFFDKEFSTDEATDDRYMED